MDYARPLLPSHTQPHAPSLLRVEVSAHLWPGASSTAHPVYWDGSQFVADTRFTHTVVDALGRCCALYDNVAQRGEQIWCVTAGAMLGGNGALRLEVVGGDYGLIRYGVASADIAKGGSGVAQLYMGWPGGSEHLVTATPTVVTPLGDIASGQKLHATYINGRWQASAVEC